MVSLSTSLFLIGTTRPSASDPRTCLAFAFFAPGNETKFPPRTSSWNGLDRILWESESKLPTEPCSLTAYSSMVSQSIKPRGA